MPLLYVTGSSWIRVLTLSKSQRLLERRKETEEKGEVAPGKNVGAYTSTGVRPPWVTEQQTAPAKA
jgi:hypothetical protein